MDVEGYWFLARESLLEIFGERTAAILQQLQQLKYELSMLQRNPATVDPEKLVKRFRNEVLLAFQVDALCQTALEIEQNSLSLFSVVDGEGRMRRGTITIREQVMGVLWLTVVDEEDGEENRFKFTGDRLETTDNGVVLVFAREPTFLFSDIELDTLERLLEDYGNS